LFHVFDVSGGSSQSKEDDMGMTYKTNVLLRPRRRWEYNIKMDVKEDVDWIHLAQYRVQLRVPVKTVMTILTLP
jgi:hypothetical protein